MVPVVVLFALALFGGLSHIPVWIVWGLLIWAGLWFLSRVAGGQGRQRRARGERYRERVRSKRKARRWARDQWIAAMQEEVPPSPPPPPQAIAPPPQPVVNLNRLPADVEKKVDRIGRKAAVLGQHRERFPIGSKDLYVVQRTASDYLPTTVKAYVDVPPWSVDTPTAAQPARHPRIQAGRDRRERPQAAGGRPPGERALPGGQLRPRRPRRADHPPLRGARGGRPPLPEPPLLSGTLGAPAAQRFASEAGPGELGIRDSDARAEPLLPATPAERCKGGQAPPSRTPHSPGRSGRLRRGPPGLGRRP
jgi:hypothetical protein